MLDDVRHQWMREKHATKGQEMQGSIGQYNPEAAETPRSRLGFHRPIMANLGTFPFGESNPHGSPFHPFPIQIIQRLNKSRFWLQGGQFTHLLS